MTVPIITRLVGQLRAKGMAPADAERVARQELTKNGILRPGTDQLTFYGAQRNSMTPAQRAVDRAVQASGRSHKHGDYVYDPKTNRATLKETK